MKEKIVKKLYEKYNEYEAGKAIGMKFMYRFQDMEVSVYFDGFDEQYPVFVLILKYKSEYAFIPLNPWEEEARVLENRNLPEGILQRMFCDGTLEAFWMRLEQELDAGMGVFRNYKADMCFKRLLQEEYKVYGNSPFFGGFVPGNMETWEVEKFQKCLSISTDVLQQVQEQGYSIKLVERCKERKKISAEVKKLWAKGHIREQA